jgi:hypothetical protein
MPIGSGTSLLPRNFNNTSITACAFARPEALAPGIAKRVLPDNKVNAGCVICLSLTCANGELTTAAASGGMRNDMPENTLVAPPWM